MYFEYVYIYIHKLINLIDQGWAIMCGVTGRSAADISLPEKQHVFAKQQILGLVIFPLGFIDCFVE